jgi:thiol-disulfide isomerase/thioredoxin
MREFERRRFLTAGVATAATVVSGCAGVPGIRGADEPTTTARGDDFRLPVLGTEEADDETVRVEPPGEVVLLDFFAPWCRTCEPLFPELRAVRDAHPDVHMRSITWENDRAAVRRFWQDHGGDWPVVVDEHFESGERYGISDIPTLVVLDAAGTEVWRHTGRSQASVIGEHLAAARE